MRLRVSLWGPGACTEQHFWHWVPQPELLPCGELPVHITRHHGHLPPALGWLLLLDGCQLPPAARVADVVRDSEELVAVPMAVEADGGPYTGTVVTVSHSDDNSILTDAYPTTNVHNSIPDTEVQTSSARDIPRVFQCPLPGLCYVPDLLTPEEEAALIWWIDHHGAAWSQEISRRTQQYGPKFQYGGASRVLQPNAEYPTIPSAFLPLINRLRNLPGEHSYPYEPDQIIVNEYYPGQGIALHVDRPDLFDDCIASVSLLSDAVMDFQPTMAVAFRHTEA
eukprot:EG_transcript_22644